MDPASDDTLHNRGNPARNYVPSVFDVAHDNGLSTALYASKTKFSLFDQSWNAENGAADTTGPDNGRDKIDRFVVTDTNQNAVPIINGNGTDISGFANDLGTERFNYSFVHIAAPALAGHSSGWGSPAWITAVKSADGYLGSIFDTIDNHPQLTDRTAVIVTSDHGGSSIGHGRSNSATNYTVPFYLWGPGVSAASDLYSL